MLSVKGRIIERHEAYREFNMIKQQDIEVTNGILLKLGEVCPGSAVINEVDSESIHFQVFGFKILIKYSIVLLTDIGCVQWYNIVFNPETQKHTGSMIMEYYFDHLGNIYKDASKAKCSSHTAFKQKIIICLYIGIFSTFAI